MTSSSVRGMREARQSLPENVRALGWVSFANDLASELVYPILPLFLAITLGAPVAVIGLIEGIAEGVAVAFRGAAGVLSDRVGSARRRPWIFAGYATSAAARPVIALAPAWGWVLGARVADRLGKATRTAPRDALILESTPPQLLGAAFGYHRALDTLGAVVGPLVALAALALGASLRAVLFLAIVPGLVTLVMLRGVREAPRRAAASRPSPGGAGRLPARFWVVLAIWTVFSLGNSSDVFLILRANDLGLTTTLTVLAYVVYNVVYAGLSWPLGALSDRIARPAILASGLAVFALVYLGFASAGSSWVVWPLFAVYGVYIAATEGVARALVGDTAGEGGAGTAYGIFAAVTGAALLAASIVAGLLWSRINPSAPFYLGAVTATVALALLLAWLALAGRRPRAVRTG